MDAPETLPKQAPEGLRVCGPHLDQQAVLARHLVNLEHLRDLGDAARRLLRSGLLLGPHEDEAQQGQSDRHGTDPSLVAFDHPSLFELSDPFEDGRGSEVDLPGDLGVRSPRVGLEDLQDLDVCSVDHSQILVDSR